MKSPYRQRPTAPTRAESLEQRRLLSFAAAVDYAVGGVPTSVVGADLNGDGRLDLVTTGTGDAGVSVLLGNGNGTFQPARVSATGAGPTSVAVGDFNGDARPDLATANHAGVNVLIGNGDGTFRPPTLIPSAPSVPASLAVGDLNADGNLDLAVSSNIYYPPTYGPYGVYPGTDVGHVAVLLGTGSGTFAPPRDTAFSPGTPSGTVVADFNADGRADVVTGAGGLVILRGDGTGALAIQPTIYIAPSTGSVAAGDVNGDGKLDALTANPMNNTFSVIPGNGAAGFGTPKHYGVNASAKSIALADVNGDGKPDVLTANTAEGTVGVLFNALGGFTAPVVSPTGNRPAVVAASDFNGDGRPDAAAANANAATVSVLLNDGSWPTGGTPSISIGDTSTSEGGVAGAAFTVSVSHVSLTPVTVRYATETGTAGADDFVGASETLTFAPGEQSKTVTVAIRDDRVGEEPETFAVRLTDPTGAVIARAVGAGTINDNEPRVLIDAVVRSPEGNTGTRAMVFNVSLTSATDVPVSVNYSTATGDLEWEPDQQYPAQLPPASVDDFRAKSGTIAFAPGELSKQIIVEVNGDRAVEPDEAFSINLSGASGAVIIAGHAVAVITNDEPYVWVNGSNVTEGNSGTKSLAFFVSLSAAYDAPVTVSYATSDGTATVAAGDYVAKSGTVTFAPGETSKTVNVSTLGDRVYEPTEAFGFNLTGAPGATISIAIVQGYIVDDEPQAGAGGNVVTEGNSGTKSLAFAVFLSVAYDVPVTVSYATADGTATVAAGDYVARSGTVTFAPGETNKTVNVSVRGDRIAEEDEAFSFNLTAATGATFSDIPVHGDILDNEPRVSVSDSSVREGNSGTRTMTFTVTLDEAYDQPVTVRYRTTDGTARAALGDYVAKSGTVTFNPGQTSRTFTVSVKGDTRSERNEYFSVVLGASSTNTRFLGNVARGTILNDDR